jgi:tetratricopeptide (TPR) repeat protein
VPTGRYDQAVGYLRRARAAAQEAGHKPSEARAIASLGRQLATGAQPAAAIEEITAALPGLAGLEEDESIVAVWGALSRAHMLHGDFAASVEWADRALPLAERLDMVPEIADILNTRATSLGFGGRIRESVAGLRGVLEMSASYGLPNAILRARINLSSVLTLEDPVDSWKIAAEGFEDAKRAGTVDLMTTMGSNAAESALHTGEWESAESILGELVEVDLAPSDRFIADGFTAVAAVLSGRPYDAALARVEAFAATSEEPAVVSQLNATRGWIAFVEGRFADAHTCYATALDALKGGISADEPMRARAALWAGKPELAQEAADAQQRAGSHGRGINASTRTTQAGIAALTGHKDEAAVAYRDAMHQWRELESLFDLALCELDFVKFVGGESPEVEAAASEARAIFTRLGAPALLKRLDEAVGLRNS